MAGRILDRRALREQADQLQPPGGVAPDTAPVPGKKLGKAKKPAAPRVKKTRAKKAPPRLRARWGVFDATMKQVAIFVKEPMPEPAPVEAVVLE